MTNNKFQQGTVATIFGWLLLFVLVPNVLVLIISFLTENRQSAYFVDFSFSLESYKALFNDTYATVLWNSFKMSAIATFFCLIIGYPFAFMIAKMPAKYRPILLFLVVLPFWTNSLIRIYGIKIFLGVKGVLNETLLSLGLIDEPLRLLNSELAIIIGLVYILLPFMILPIYNAVQELPSSLIAASRDLGATPWQTLKNVVIPLTMSGVRSGVQAVFIPSLSLFMLTRLIGGNRVITLGTAVEQHFLVTQNWGMGSTIGVILIVAMIILMFVTRDRRKGGEA